MFVFTPNATDTRKPKWAMTHGSPGANILLSEVVSLTFTLTNRLDGTTINSRSAQSVLNANGGTFVDGYFTMQFAIADTTLVDATQVMEEHVGLFALLLTDGQHHTEEVILKCRKLADE